MGFPKPRLDSPILLVLHFSRGFEDEEDGSPTIFQTRS